MGSPFFARLPRSSAIGSSIRSFASPVRTTSLSQALSARGAGGGSGFHTSSRRLGLKTVEQAKSRYRSGVSLSHPISWFSTNLSANYLGFDYYFCGIACSHFHGSPGFYFSLLVSG